LKGIADDEGKYVADSVAEDVIIKADNEPALQKLVRFALKELNVTAESDGLEQAGQEQSPPYDSQANGLTEIGVKILRAQFRTMKACLQRRLMKRMPEAHPVAAWLLEHCCTLLNAIQRGSDGMTPWLRARGRPFSKRLVGFGETVLYKLATKGPAFDARGNSVARWSQGVFLGYSHENNTYVIGNGEKIETSRALMRRPFQNRWNHDEVGKVQSTPWLQWKPEDGPPEVSFEPAAERLQEFPDRRSIMPRQFYVKKKDLESHGYTVGCEQCNHMQRYGVSRPGVRHTDKCRSRIMAELGRSPEGQIRLQETEDRINKGLAEYVEAKEQAGSGGDPGPAERPVRVPDVLPDLPQEEGPLPEARLPQVQSTPARASTESPVRPRQLREGPTGLPRVMVPPRVEASPEDEEMREEPAAAADADQGMDVDFVEHDEMSLFLLMQLGHGGRSYSRERKTAYRRIVSEIFSPPCIADHLARFPHTSTWRRDLLST